MRKRIEQAFQAVEQIGCSCIVCNTPMIQTENALRCLNGHTVNANRKGYFNFLSRPVSGVYDKALFEARRRVLEAGYYKSLIDAILPYVQREAVVLDAGCGDGYYIRMLRDMSVARFAGVDISRDAIESAADGESLWCVADMRHLPFAAHTFDLVLNILSPADYHEFRRVLKPDGILVKVTPGPSYLEEIRRARGLEPGYQSAADPYLQLNMNAFRTVHICETHSIPPETWADFVRMTPMNQNLSPEELEVLCARQETTITIDLNITFANP